jgi:hypothetical protein
MINRSPLPDRDNITIYPYVILDSTMFHPVDINHEFIHFEQEKELSVVGFYGLYILESLIKLPLHNFSIIDVHDEISFEREANYYESNLQYLNQRKKLTWLKFIFKNHQKQ